MIRSVRKTLISVFAAIMLSSCLCFGIFAAINKNAVSAAPAEITIASLGAHNDNIFILNTTGGDASNAGGKQITVYINDEPNDIWVHEGDASSVTLAIGKSAYRLNDESYLHIRVPAGTRFGDCVLKEDYDFYNLMNVNGGFVYVGQESTTAVAITGLNGVIKDHAGQQRWYISLGASVAEGVDIDGQIWNCNVFYATADDDIKGSYTLYGGKVNEVNVNKESNSALGLIIDYELVGETSGTTGHKRLYKIPAGTVWGGYHGACRITNSFYLLYDGDGFVYSESDPTVERTLSFVGLTNQKESERYIMTLNGGTGNGEYGSEICDVIVKTDGAEKTAKLWNWGEDLAIYISYDVLPNTGYHVFEIEKQALTGGYTLEGVFLAIRDGEVTTPITFDEVKIVFAEGHVQEDEELNIHRYRIYLTFEKEFVAANGVLGSWTVSVNGKDVSAEVEYYPEANGVILSVNLADAPKNQRNEIIVKAGAKLVSDTCNFTVAEDFTVYTEGGRIDPVLPEPVDNDIKIVSIEGFAQDVDSENLHRYLVYLNFDKEFEYPEFHVCDVTVSVNGKEEVAGVYNDSDNKRVFIIVDYTVAPKETKNEITIKAETAIGNFVVTEDFSFVTEGDKVYVPSPELPEENVKIVSIEGATQDVDSANLHRYLIYLYFDKAFEYSEFRVGDITVSVNGKDEVVGAYNDADGKCVFLTVDYTIAPKETKNEITIKAGTKFANYVVTEELTVKTKGTAVEIKTDLVDMEIEWKKDLLGYLEGGTQDNLGRYVFYIQTNLENIGDTMWNGNECVIDAGTENERYAPIYYFGGIAKPDSEDYDGTAILVILNYNDIEEGARNAAEIATHSVTIKKGSELGGGYLIANDLTLWLRGEDFAENEDELPEPPDGVFSLSRGIENKSIEYAAQNIEDYIAGASVVKLKAGAEKLVDNNVFFAACDHSLLCKSIKIIGKKSEPQIKFRSVYSGGDVYLALEIRSESDNGNHWIEQGAPIVRLRYCGSKAAETDVSECLWFDFFTDGLQNSPLIASFTNDEFRLDEGEFFVEFGAENKTDSYGKEGFVFFVNVIQGEKQAYAECLMTGENNVSEAGDVAIYQGPFNTARIDVDYVKWTEKDVKDFTLMSVDSERTIDGETVKIGAMSFYSPQLRREENYDKYDISDIIPIGNGKTYTKVEGDVTSASQSMINATNVSAGNGGYSVKMKITFTGDDFGCTFAFRGKNTHAASGYVIHIAEDQVIIGSIAKASPFKTGETYEIEVGCVDYFVAEEKVSSGAFVFLKVNGELVIEDSIDKKAGLGTYFCGLIEGAGGSTVTIAAVNDSAKQPVITTKSNKTVVANGKKTTLSYESDMPTAFDEVTYEVVKGKARIDGDGLFSESDGEIVVRAKITNEFGTFYGSEITLNAGAKDGGGCSCGASLDGAIFVLPLIAAAAIAIIFKKRREN